MSDDAEVLCICRELSEMHPGATTMQVKDVLQAIISLQSSSESLIECARDVAANHESMCQLSAEDGGWKGRERRFIPSLRSWIWQGRDPVRKPEAPRRAGGAVEY